MRHGLLTGYTAGVSPAIGGTLDISTSVPMNLRLSKLLPPLSPAALLVRNRLGIGSGLFPAAKLIVVHAPAGFGKTTLLAQWREQLQNNKTATAWITLDEADNDPARFLGYLVAALAPIVPELGQESILGSYGPDQVRSFLGIVTELIDSLANLEVPFVLFLDDFEYITDERVLEAVRRLADQLPMHQQIVIGSRRAPEVGFARLRVRGLAIEFSMGALRFSEDETREFFRTTRGLALSDHEVHILQKDTEGWVVALQLVALSLAAGQSAGSLLDALSTSSAGITDYLADDVFSRQSEDIRLFLLETCILNQLSAPLCDMVTGRQDSLFLLEQIERSNLFLMPLDSERTRFRYHSVFAEFLRGRLLRTHSLDASALHRRASAWHAEQGWWISSVRHALTTGDMDYAAQRMEQGVDETLHAGRMATIAGWIDSLPAEILRTRIALEIKYAWALIFLYRYAEAQTRLESLALRLAASDGGKQCHADDLRAMRVVLLGFTDHFEDAYTMGVEELPRISNDGPFGRAIVASAMAYATIASGRFAETTPLLDIVRESHQRTNSAVGLIHHQLLTGMAELAQGRLHAALRHFTGASIVPEGMSPNSQGPVAAAVYLADAMYETNQIGDSEKHLLCHLEGITESGMWDFLIQSHRTLTLIHRARQDWDGAHKWVDALERLGQKREVSRIVASARLLRARLAIDSGDLNYAEQQIELAEAGADWLRYEDWRPFANEHLMPSYVRCRLMLAQGEYHAAQARLKLLLRQAEAKQRSHRALLIRVLLVKATVLSGDEAAAIEILGEVVSLAMREGYRRTLLDEGEPITRILCRIHAEKILEEPRRLDEHRNQGGRPGASSIGVRVPFTDSFNIREQFSSREMQVLYLVAQGFSNQMVADRLFLSEATIKFHLRNINAKTGAKNRVQAVAIARRLGLLS
ncbi:LuxR C-terminal-related transcriptional regulator [Castellaniella sp. GW247-6E4]|uniref:LuxR C-terminal-related transcriptional regulator n=1 Tax=Castellaniella sp. GW247-6E4 TaxID=3140380 RepID=UPI003315E3AB